MSENRSVIRAITILECLFEDDFKGKTLDELVSDTDIPWSTTWRMLKTLEGKGWIVEIPVSGSKQGIWKVSDKIVGIAFQYKKHALNAVQSIEKNYVSLSGEMLRND